MYIEGIDEIDNRILEIIKDNARLNYSEIGAMVGISRVAVRNRMDSLHEKGIIKGYKTIIDGTKVPDGIEFIVDIETKPDSFEDILEKLSQSTYIRKIQILSGDCIIQATGFVSNSRNLQVFANAFFRGAKDGICKMSCRTVMSTVMDVDGGVKYERYQECEHMEEGTENGEQA